MKCLKCENEAVHFCDCLKVEHKVVSFGNSKQTTEQTTGIEQVGLCKEHLKKMIRKNHSVLAPTMPYLLAIGAMILGFILGIAGTTNSANGGGSEPLQIAGIIIAMIGIAYGLIYDFVIAYSALRKKPSKVYGRLDHEVSVMFSGNTTLYVPLEDGIYPDEKAFNRINSYLTTDIKHKIYCLNLSYSAILNLFPDHLLELVKGPATAFATKKTLSEKLPSFRMHQ
jgi:hypothetical protein